jgi:TetR/AcrR family transcriptional regulator, cholesterol catabolism regulator
MSKLKSRRNARAAAGKSLYTDRKELIRKAAGNVFLRKGFLATKLSDIAEEANMDRASLYYYVGSKQDLFEDIFTISVKDNIGHAESIEAEEIPCLEKLSKLMIALMTSFEEKYPYYFIFVQEDLKKIEEMGDPKNAKWLATSKTLSKEYFEIFNRIISAGIENGEIKPVMPPRLITNSIIGMMISSSRWFRPNGIMKSKEIGIGMAKMILDGLREETK